MYSYSSCTELSLASCMVNAIGLSVVIGIHMCLLLAVFDMVVIAVENCSVLLAI